MMVAEGGPGASHVEISDDEYIMDAKGNIKSPKFAGGAGGDVPRFFTITVTKILRSDGSIDYLCDICKTTHNSWCDKDICPEGIRP